MSNKAQAAKLLARPDLQRAAELFADACRISRDHMRAAAAAPTFAATRCYSARRECLAC